MYLSHFATQHTTSLAIASRLSDRDIDDLTYTHTSQDTKLSRDVIDGEQTAPLLHGDGLVRGDLEAALPYLRVVALEVEVDDHAARITTAAALRRSCFHRLLLLELLKVAQSCRVYFEYTLFAEKTLEEMFFMVLTWLCLSCKCMQTILILKPSYIFFYQRLLTRSESGC